MSRNGEASPPSLSLASLSLTSVNHAAQRIRRQTCNARSCRLLQPPLRPSTGKYKQTITRETFGIHSRGSGGSVVLRIPSNGSSAWPTLLSCGCSHSLLGYFHFEASALNSTLRASFHLLADLWTHSRSILIGKRNFSTIADL